MCNNNEQKLLQKIITENYYRELLQEIMTGNYQLVYIKTRNYEEKLLQEIISYYINDAKNVRIIGILAYPKM